MPNTYFCDTRGVVLHTEPGALQLPKYTGMKVRLTTDGSESRVVDSYYEATPGSERSELVLVCVFRIKPATDAVGCPKLT